MPNHTPQRRTLPPNAPHYSLAAAVLLVTIGIVAAYLTDDRAHLTTLLGLIVTTVPSLLAAGYAERASRDIRNGTVTEKAREGTVQALDQTGVTEVVEAAGRGQSTVLAMQALSQLLRDAETRAERDRPPSS